MPRAGRFLNADDTDVLDADQDSLVENNLFAYCLNNPVNMADDDGEIAWWIAAAVSGAVFDTAAYLIGSAVSGKKVTWGGVGKAALTGAVTGLCFGAVGKIASKAVTAVKTARSVKKVASVGKPIKTCSKLTRTFTKSLCFIAGTEVLTEIGLVAIETIKEGDLVWAENPETGEKGLKPVVQTFVNEINELVHVYLNGEEIITTPGHPFYVINEGWVGADELDKGDNLILQNGKHVAVDKIMLVFLEIPVTVYNFEVADFHTYYVGQDSVLVHNTGCGLVKGKPKIVNGAKRIRVDTRKVTSEEFKDYIRSTGKTFRSSEWKYKMETWITPNGKSIERHYWVNSSTGESFFHK